jgi:hypothetical protein
MATATSIAASHAAIGYGLVGIGGTQLKQNELFRMNC